MNGDAKKSFEKRITELEAALNRLCLENATPTDRRQDHVASSPKLADPFEPNVIAAKALRKFVFEELPLLFNDGNNLGLVPNGLVSFVSYPNGSIYPHFTGTIDCQRLDGVARHYLAAHVAKQIDSRIKGLIDTYHDPELRRMLERGC